MCYIIFYIRHFWYTDTIEKNFSRLIICYINDETHHNSTLHFLLRDLWNSHREQYCESGRKIICKKKNQKRKVITIDSENGENKMKALSDWFSNYKHYNFFLTLQSYIQGIITAHSKKPKLFSLIRKIGAN